MNALSTLNAADRAKFDAARKAVESRAVSDMSLTVDSGDFGGSQRLAVWRDAGAVYWGRIGPDGQQQSARKLPGRAN